MANDKKTLADNEAIEAFYREIGQVCVKHNIAGLVGMWFHKSTDNYGFITNYDVTDSQMKGVCTFVAEKLEGWADDIHKGPQIGYIKEIATLDKKKN